MGFFYCVYYNRDTGLVFVQAHLHHELILDQMAQKSLGLYDHTHSYLGIAVHVFTEERVLSEDDWIKITQSLKTYSNLHGVQTYSE